MSVWAESCARVGDPAGDPKMVRAKTEGAATGDCSGLLSPSELGGSSEAMEGASVSCSAGSASALNDLRAGYFLASVAFPCPAGILCESELDEPNCGSDFRARDLAPSLSRRATELGAFWASSGLEFSFCFRAAANAASLDLGPPAGLEVPPSSPPRG